MESKAGGSVVDTTLLRICLGDISPLRLPRSQHPLRPHLPALDAVQLRPYVQVKVQRWLPRFFFSLIEVNDVFHLLPITPLYDPVMAIKGTGVTHQAIELRLRRQSAGTEAFE